MITYLKGDATQPIGEDQKLIIHCCNDIGKWGRGFVMALSSRWSEPEKEYRKLGLGRMLLGYTQFVKVEEDITVCNMIGQHDIISYTGKDNPPVRYNAIEMCLEKINAHAITNNCTIHAPRFGCGLAGGKWEIIEEIISRVITVDVFIYDFE